MTVLFTFENIKIASRCVIAFGLCRPLRMSGHNYATLVKSGLQTQSNLVRELKVSKEELPRRYLTIIMENLHTNITKTDMS